MQGTLSPSNPTFDKGFYFRSRGKSEVIIIVGKAISPAQGSSQATRKSCFTIITTIYKNCCPNVKSPEGSVVNAIQIN